MWIQAFIQPTLIKSFCETGNLSYPGNMELKRIISYLTEVSIVRKTVITVQSNELHNTVNRGKGNLSRKRGEDCEAVFLENTA